MSQHLLKLTLFLSLLLSNIYSQIIIDDAGNKFITLGSTKNEVLEVLGTPTSVHGSRIWLYGYESINFDDDKVAGYSNSAKLKIKMIPSIKYKK